MNKILVDKLSNFSRALDRLEESLANEENSFYIDATIKRFELTFETAWKVLKKILYLEGFECLSPRDCLKKGYQTAYLNDEDIWIEMLLDRNRSAHIYNEQEAGSICQKIRDTYFTALKQLNQVLKKKITQL